MRRMITVSGLAILAVLTAQAQTPTIPKLREPAAASKDARLNIGRTTCNGQEVSMPVSATLRLGAREESMASVYIAVNGAATETFKVRVVRGSKGVSTLSFSRTLSLPANRPDASLRIYVDGQPASPVQTVPYSCYTAATPTRRADSSASFGDVEVGPYVFAYSTPTRPLNVCERRDAGVDGVNWDNFWACGAPPMVAPLRSSSSPEASDDFSELEGVGPPGLPAGLHVFRSSAPARLNVGNCERESDALNTVLFMVSIKTSRITKPVAYAGEGFWESRYAGPAPRYLPGAGYWDYRIMQMAPAPRHKSFPGGYEWIAFQRQLPCTRNGEMVYTYDQDNRLREDDESNNTIRVPYSTIRNY